MKINNGPVLCPHCGCLSAYYEIDRLAAIREKVNKEGGSAAWDSTLQAHKKKGLFA
ncbi:putative cytoplasmic protein [Salmonella enterica subsp. enterica]|uniref:Putative cytoplasmic protein n=1 Tax=Salmonella enterica I TaxID=59201 RepID=A0A3S4K8B4_SALET|nr:putative cytoplasmic protein [Salmonella enterica subsp. enterica]